MVEIKFEGPMDCNLGRGFLWDLQISTTEKSAEMAPALTEARRPTWLLSITPGRHLELFLVDVVVLV